MAIILLLETGTDTCSVALANDGKVVSVVEDFDNRDHAAKLGVFVDDILRENGVLPTDLDAVAISKGPGSYTGLRIGTSLAKGMCYGLKIPLLAIGTLESLAHMAAAKYDAGRLNIGKWQGITLCPMVDARRMEVYAQLFDSDLQPLTTVAAEIITEHSFDRFISQGKFLIFGSGAEKCQQLLCGENVMFANVKSSAQGMALLAQKAYSQGQFEDLAYFEPLYLKDFVTTTSTKKLF